MATDKDTKELRAERLELDKSKEERLRRQQANEALQSSIVRPEQMTSASVDQGMLPSTGGTGAGAMAFRFGRSAPQEYSRPSELDTPVNIPQYQTLEDIAEISYEDMMLIDEKGRDFLTKATKKLQELAYQARSIGSSVKNPDPSDSVAMDLAREYNELEADALMFAEQARSGKATQDLVMKAKAEGKLRVPTSEVGIRAETENLFNPYAVGSVPSDLSQASLLDEVKSWNTKVGAKEFDDYGAYSKMSKDYDTKVNNLLARANELDETNPEEAARLRENAYAMIPPVYSSIAQQKLNLDKEEAKRNRYGGQEDTYSDIYKKLAMIQLGGGGIENLDGTTTYNEFNGRYIAPKTVITGVIRGTDGQIIVETEVQGDPDAASSDVVFDNGKALGDAIMSNNSSINYGEAIRYGRDMGYLDSKNFNNLNPEGILEEDEFKSISAYNNARNKFNEIMPNFEQAITDYLNGDKTFTPEGKAIGDKEDLSRTGTVDYGVGYPLSSLFDEGGSVELKNNKGEEFILKRYSPIFGDDTYTLIDPVTGEHKKIGDDKEVKDYSADQISGVLISNGLFDNVINIDVNGKKVKLGDARRELDALKGKVNKSPKKEDSSKSKSQPKADEVDLSEFNLFAR